MPSKYAQIITPNINIKIRYFKNILKFIFWFTILLIEKIINIYVIAALIIILTMCIFTLFSSIFSLFLDNILVDQVHYLSLLINFLHNLQI